MNTSTSTLNDEQRRSVCDFAVLGCDRTTACHLASCSLTELRAELIANRSFHIDLLRSEAKAKLHHLRNIHQAAIDAKNWRASTWWLERAEPHVYGGRPVASLTAQDLQNFVDAIAAAAVDEFPCPADRERFIARFGA